MPFFCPRAFADFPEAHERNLGRVDDAEDRICALITEIGDRDRGVGELRASEAAGPGAFHKILQRLHELGKAELIGVVDGWGDEATAPQ